MFPASLQTNGQSAGWGAHIYLLSLEIWKLWTLNHKVIERVHRSHDFLRSAFWEFKNTSTFEHTDDNWVTSFIFFVMMQWIGMEALISYNFSWNKSWTSYRTLFWPSHLGPFAYPVSWLGVLCHRCARITTEFTRDWSDYLHWIVAVRFSNQFHLAHGWSAVGFCVVFFQPLPPTTSAFTLYVYHQTWWKQVVCVYFSIIIIQKKWEKPTTVYTIDR